MPPSPPPAELLAAIPGTTARLATILGALAALIARAFLRHPAHVVHIVPLWNYIGRTTRRLARTLGRLAEGHPCAPRPNRKPTPSATPRKPRGYPTTRAWLRAALAHEAVGIGSQLTHLLNQPETRALLQAAPQAGRLLRPICHFLGVQPDAIRRPPRPAAPPASPAPSQPNPAPPSPRRLPRIRPAPPPEPSCLSPLPPQPLCSRMAGRWPWNALPA